MILKPKAGGVGNMKNLLNFHCVGVHSFPLEYKDGLYKRVFYADKNHELYKDSAIAIHSHHVDLKITVLKGQLDNKVYALDDQRGEEYNKYRWDSHISGGCGKFISLGKQNLSLTRYESYDSGYSFFLRSDLLHTVFVPENRVCSWLVEEFPASKPYDGINYSKVNLENWTAEGLYIECDDQTANKYLSEINIRKKIL